MAFTSAVVNRFMVAGGEIVETGTWTMTGGTVQGQINPAQSGQGINAGIQEIYEFGVSDNVANPATISLDPNGRKFMIVSATALDAGTYYMRGRVA